MTVTNQHIIDSIALQHQPSSSDCHASTYSLCISIVKEFETLVEVAAQHYYGNDKKWDFVALMEATKMIIRLAMLHNGGYKMLLNGEMPNPGTNFDEISGSFNSKGPFSSGLFRNLDDKKMPNMHGKALYALNKFGENARIISENTWYRRVQHQHSIMEPPGKVIPRATLTQVFSEKGVPGVLFVLGELLFISRPLVYVLLIRKYGQLKWTPFLISLAIDMIGVGLLPILSHSKIFDKEPQLCLSDSERNELKRRKILWAFYLMRDPFFSNYTRPKLESTERTLGHVPLIGFLTAKLVELLIGAQTRYTYMSGS